MITREVKPLEDEDKMALKRGNVAKQEDADMFDPTEVDVIEATNDDDGDEENETVNEVENEVVEAPVNVPAPVQPKQVANTGGVPTGDLAQSMGELGFEGLDFGFGAFPIITLNDGQFSSNDVELGDSFDCRVQSSRQKIVYRTRVAEGETPELVYTYDDQSTTKGENVKDVLQDWDASGTKYDRKAYLDVIVEVCGDNDLTGQLAVLSVSPQSATRFSGYLAQVVRLKRVNPQDVVTTVYRGRKITGTRFPYYPWAFKLAS